MPFTENQLAEKCVDMAFRIHSRLGPGLLESVYEEIFCLELRQRGLEYSRQFPVRVKYGDIILDQGFRADIIVEGKLLLELKSVESIAPVHYKQVMTYLKLTDIRLGLLINFNEALIKLGIKRVVNGL
jgi:GxxExxY protein